MVTALMRNKVFSEPKIGKKKCGGRGLLNILMKWFVSICLTLFDKIGVGFTIPGTNKSEILGRTLG